MRSFGLPFLAILTLVWLQICPAGADQASQLQAARDLMASMHMDQLYAQIIDKMLDAQLSASPQLMKMRAPMKQFMEKYMGWDAMKDDMAQIYALFRGRNEADGRLLSHTRRN